MMEKKYIKIPMEHVVNEEVYAKGGLVTYNEYNGLFKNLVQEEYLLTNKESEDLEELGKAIDMLLIDLKNCKKERRLRKLRNIKDKYFGWLFAQKNTFIYDYGEEEIDKAEYDESEEDKWIENGGNI